MASAADTRLTALVVSATVVAVATIGGSALYVGGAIKSTGNISSSGSLIISTDVITATSDFCERVAGEEANCYSTISLTVTGTTLHDQKKVNDMARYDIVSKANPLTSSGVITRAEVHMNGVPDSFTMDCGFRKAAGDGTGTDIMNDILLSHTGYVVTALTGATLMWNGADYVDCGTVTNSGTFTTGAKLKLWYHGVTGE